MNLLHLKYAVEVENSRSLNKAAERLYTSQPNLSRAIKELEESLDIQIFNRTPTGMVPTSEGTEFIKHAKKILAEVNKVRDIYNKDKKNKEFFSISSISSDYISKAFINFIKDYKNEKLIEFTFHETNQEAVFEDIQYSDYNLGIIILNENEKHKLECHLKNYNLKYKILKSFKPKVVFSKNSFLSIEESLTFDKLKNYMSIINSTLKDASPSRDIMPTNLGQLIPNEFANSRGDSLFLKDIESILTALSVLKDTYFISPPFLDETLGRYNLMEKDLDTEKYTGFDKFNYVLIYKNDYSLNSIDSRFLNNLK